MALPRLLQKLFQNGGAGPRLLKAIMPDGVVFSVNGNSPDADGDVSVSIPTYTHPSTHPASMITGLATVATSGSYNDLSNRPSIPATPKAYITSTWESGKNWYRKWSDGWIEMGGTVSFTANQSGITYTTFTLHTAFSNTNYTFVGLGGASAKSPLCYKVSTKTTTQISLGAYGNNTSEIMWYACGY